MNTKSKGVSKVNKKGKTIDYPANPPKKTFLKQ